MMVEFDLKTEKDVKTEDGTMYMGVVLGNFNGYKQTSSFAHSNIDELDKHINDIHSSALDQGSVFVEPDKFNDDTDNTYTVFLRKVDGKDFRFLQNMALAVITESLDRYTSAVQERDFHAEEKTFTKKVLN